MIRITLIILLTLPISIFAQSGKVKEKKESRAATSETESMDFDKSLEAQPPAAGFKAQYINTRNKAINKYSKEISTSEQNELDGILGRLEQTSPDSYEYHYTAYINSNNDPNAFTHLEKAYAIYPNNVELYDDFISYYELTNNDQGKKQFCDKLYKSNTISQGVMDYNYNVLMSLEPNAILFTNGSDDTYPIWIWQEIKNTRKDVTVLNLDLIQNLDYQKNKLKELNIYPVSSKKPVDIVKEVVKNNPARPINIGLTVNPKALKDLQDKLYLTGLVLKYSEQPLDNVAQIKNNWDYRFKKDFTSKKVTNAKERKLNNNYILPILVLSKYYQDQGDANNSKKLEKDAIKIATEGDKVKIVENYLKK